SQIFVDRINFVIVVRLDENVADENARDDGAEGELQIGIISQRKSFARRPEKCAGAGFGGNERSENGPPCDLATAESEVGEVLFLAAHVKADRDDDHKVDKQDSAIDREPCVHASLF